MHHPSWIEVDLAAIAHNVRAIKRFVGPNVRVNAVVKGNGYGHGAIEVARTALDNGAHHLSVAYLKEAIELRAAGIVAPILVLAFTPAELVPEALRHNLAFSVSDWVVARAASKAAVALQTPARIHIKIDTGMSRLGVLASQAAAFTDEVRRLPGIEVEGLFTHFACADCDEAYTWQQLAAFQNLAGLEGIRYIHAANSAATLAFPKSHFNMVRPGLALYGLTPFVSGWGKLPIALRPALSWKAQIALVKTLPAGTPVSYGNTYVCPSSRTIAVIPVGYADGFRRAPHHFGEVLVRGQRAPIVGRVCMDQTVIDVTDIPNTQQGDEVVIIGSQGADRITAEDVAARIGSINYEVTTALLGRVPRVYKSRAGLRPALLLYTRSYLRPPA
ncbi:MAG: alanine racemase [Anaerolineae bacterium]|nr:alanine racemase [Anaerolineae bacterium]